MIEVEIMLETSQDGSECCLQFPSCDSPIHPGPWWVFLMPLKKTDDFRSPAAAVRCWVLFLNKSLPTAMEAPGHESSGSVREFSTIFVTVHVGS